MVSRSVEQIKRVVIEGGLSTPASIGRGFRGVLATDTWHRWAVGQYLEVDAAGKWFADTVILERSDPGYWLDVATGGGYGAGWPDERSVTETGDPALELAGSIGAC